MKPRKQKHLREPLPSVRERYHYYIYPDLGISTVRIVFINIAEPERQCRSPENSIEMTAIKVRSKFREKEKTWYCHSPNGRPRRKGGRNGRKGNPWIHHSSQAETESVSHPPSPHLIICFVQNHRRHLYLVYNTISVGISVWSWPGRGLHIVHSIRPVLCLRSGSAVLQHRRLHNIKVTKEPQRKKERMEERTQAEYRLAMMKYRGKERRGSRHVPVSSAVSSTLSRSVYGRKREAIYQGLQERLCRARTEVQGAAMHTTKTMQISGKNRQNIRR